MEASGEQKLSLPTKAALIVRIWFLFCVVTIGLRRSPLPEFVQRLSKPGRDAGPAVRPRHLGRIVYRVLGVGPVRPRCLISALVLYRLLRAHGVDATIVIGLPQRPKDKDAHAWVEVDGVDVGPPPGRGGHEPLVRYP